VLYYIASIAVGIKICKIDDSVPIIIIIIFAIFWPISVMLDFFAGERK
jgi:hypothetical protein